MGCGGGVLSVGGFCAFGSFVGGGGLGFSGLQATLTSAGGGAILGAAKSGLNSLTPVIGDSITDPMTAIDSATKGLVSSAALSIGGGVISGGIPGQFQSALGGATDDFLGETLSFAQQYIPTDISSATQIISQVDGFSSLSRSIMPQLEHLQNTSFGGVTDTLLNFDNGGFLGEAINSFEELSTNGLTSLIDTAQSSITDLGGNLQLLGSFGDLSDVQNLMQPGQIASQLLDKGLGDVGGIADQLQSAGVNLSDLNNPIYQNKIQSVLNGVTNIQDIADIQEVMGSNLNLPSLGNLTNFGEVIEKNLNMNVSTFSEMGDRLLKTVSTGPLENLGQLGEVATKLQSSITDADLLKNGTNLLPDGIYSSIAGIYGGGTGPAGSILMRDMLGTQANFGQELYLDTFRQGMEVVNESGEADTIKAIYQEISEIAAGTHHEFPEDKEGSTYVLDPRSGIEHETLNAAIVAKSDQLASAVSSLFNTSTESVRNALTTAEGNWRKSVEQVATEKTILAKSQIDTSQVDPGSISAMFGFASNLQTYAQDFNDKFPLMKRLTTDDAAGATVRYALNEGYNTEIFNSYDVQYIGDTIEDAEETPDPPSYTAV